MTNLFVFSCIGSYLLAAHSSFRQLQGMGGRRLRVLFPAWIAILLHGILLYQAIETDGGQNLDVVNIISMIGWIVSSLLMVTAIFKPVEGLGLFIFPLSALLVLLGWISPGKVIFHTRDNPLQLIHILSSLLAISVIGLSGLQAIAWALQARRLRLHARVQLLNIFPSLEILESLLFSTIWFGFLLLSISLITGLIYWSHVQDIHIFLKVIFVIIAWIIFAALLLGRYLFKWRGTHAINWTFAGLLLLMLAYLGTHYLH